MKKEKIDKDFRYEELHKVSLATFTQNAIELDKILLGLSVGPIGFILNFMLKEYSYINDTYNIGVIFFLLAIALFAYIINQIITIFKLNKDYFSEIIAYKQGGNLTKAFQIDKIMVKADKRVHRSFLIAILCSTIFVLSQTINKSVLEYKDQNITIIQTLENIKSINTIFYKLQDNKKTTSFIPILLCKNTH